MDDAARITGRRDWGRYWSWHTAGKIFELALRRLPSDERAALVKRIFSEGKALGWLVNVLREETFAHGRFGARKKAESERRLTVQEFEAIVPTMLKRFAETQPAELMATPDFVSLVFAWQQAAPEGEQQVRTWVARQIETDRGLLDFLENCRSWRAVNGTVIYPIAADNLKHFLDVNTARTRVENLTQSPDASLKANALRILAAMDQGTDD